MSTTEENATPETGGPLPVAGADRALFRKIGWRLLPILMLGYAIAFLDRINIGYAQLQMVEALKFSSAIFGLGAGIFFVGYVLFEVPSNLLLPKIGVRKQFLRILVLWGLASTAMMFVRTPWQFYGLRFLLGVFEAGFFPGVVLYLTYWYPPAWRGRAMAVFQVAISVISIVSGPVNGAILKYSHGTAGLDGWQWLFLIEGVPAIILGVVAYAFLRDKPEQADWLSPAEKRHLRWELEHDSSAIEKGGHGSFLHSLRDQRVYLLGLVYFFGLGSAYVLIFWIPTLVQSWGVKDLFMIGVYSSIPSVAGAIGVVLVGKSSDRMHERRWHYAIPVLVAAVSMLVITQLRGHLFWSIVALSVATIGLTCIVPLLFTIAGEYLSAPASAGGIAAISAIGGLGPAVGPAVNGLLIKWSGTVDASLYLAAGMCIVSALLVFRAVRGAPERSAAAAAPARTARV